jgi:hypothetical protein
MDIDGDGGRREFGLRWQPPQRNRVPPCQIAAFLERLKIRLKILTHPHKD